MNTSSAALVILVHGFNKSHRDMRFLNAGLQQQGFNTFCPRLPARFGALEDCRKALAAQVQPRLSTAGTVHVVAHSMGGLIARVWLQTFQPQNIGRCVFIATPHGGTRLADVSGRIPLYNRIMKPLSDLTPASTKRFSRLPRGIDLGLIAGRHNHLLLGRLFLSSDSDGRVEVGSVRCDDATDFAVLPYGHRQLHHRPETVDLTVSFLQTGRFPDDANRVGGSV